MDNQAKRFRNATALGTLIAVMLAGLVSLLLSSGDGSDFGTISMPLGFGIGTFLSIHFFWRRLLQKRETRQKGLWLGVAAGPIAVIISCYMMVWLTLIPIFANSSQPLITEGKNGFGLIAMLLLMPLLVSLFAFIFGGFLSLPLGALLGWFFSRDSAPNKSDIFD